MSLSILGASARAQAQGWNEACIAAMNDDEVAENLAFIQHSFAEQRGGAIAWWTGWTGFNIFNTAFGWYKYATAEKRLAYDNWFVSAIGASLFVVQVSILPMPGMYAYRRMSRWPDSTPVERRVKLQRAIKLLDKAVFVEDTNSNVWAHIAGFAYAVASSAYVWIRNRNADWDRLALAVGLQFGTSVAVAELTFWTVPRRARRDQRKFRQDICDPIMTRARDALGRVPEPPRYQMSLQVTPGGLALTGRF